MTRAREELLFRFVPEIELTAGDHAAISRLLVAAFPQHAAIFRAASWYGGRPDYRLWIEDSDGEIVAHLDFERREIGVGKRDVLVAGVGEVATHPGFRSRGLGRELMDRLHHVLTTEAPVDFGYLGCREEVVGFYESVGWHKIDQRTREIDPATGEWTESEGPNLILAAKTPLSEWPREETIDLRGMWW